MPDVPTPFPPLPRHSFAPDEARFAAAVRVGRRRNRRALAGLSTAVVAAVAITATGGSGAGAQRLQPASGGVLPTTEATASPSSEPEPEPTSTLLPVPLPTLPQPSPSPTKPKPSPSETTSPEPDPGGGPGGRPTGRPDPAEPPDWMDTTPATYSYLADAAPEDCITGDAADVERLDPDSAVHWCARYAGPAEFAPRERGEVPFRICRASAANAAVLERTSDRWIKAAASNERGEAEWYNATSPDPAGPTIEVQPGDCAQWTFEFPAPAQPGTYALRAAFLVEWFVDGGTGTRRPPPGIETTIEVTRRP